MACPPKHDVPLCHAANVHCTTWDGRAQTKVTVGEKTEVEVKGYGGYGGYGGPKERRKKRVPIHPLMLA
jgi:hypothetical protein